jgi:hypothetical protein
LSKKLFVPVSVTDAASLKMPPPLVAVLPLTVESLMETLPVEPSRSNGEA